MYMKSHIIISKSHVEFEAEHINRENVHHTFNISVSSYIDTYVQYIKPCAMHCV